MLWQTRLPGQPICNVINLQKCATLAARIANGLASLRRAELHTSITTDILDQLIQTKKYARYLSKQFAEYDEAIQSLFLDLEKAAPSRVSSVITPIHVLSA
jgi:hypothetical protein